jgi:hypothetical protein
VSIAARIAACSGLLGSPSVQAEAPRGRDHVADGAGLDGRGVGLGGETCEALGVECVQPLPVLLGGGLGDLFVERRAGGM